MSSATGHAGSFPRNTYARVRGRIEFGDVLLFLYALVLVRQYLWITDNNFLAWTLSVPLAAVCWYLYVSTKQFPAEKFGRSFWLVVGLPLLFAYLLRAGFPDHSYDVLSYHLINSERSLRGTLFGPGDFFPSAGTFNPAPDTLAGISRMILGFRLGTGINLLVLVWAAQVTHNILRPFVANAWLRSGCVLLTVLAENLLFEISTYMIDLLALPLMLAATLLILRADEAENRRVNVIHIALLLGASAAFKLTNLAVVLPLAVVFAYKMSVGSRRFTLPQLITTGLLAFTAFIATHVPFTIYIFRVTGNPIFPVANSFFGSPYWPTDGGWDNRWGPQTPWETIAWPVLAWFNPERHSELAVYSGRLSLGYLIALAGLVLVWRNERARLLCIVLLSSSLLWSLTAIGYSRYGLYQEMLAGITILAVVATLIHGSAAAGLSWRTAVASLFSVLLVAQSYFACSYVLRKEWGSRSTILEQPAAYARDAKFMLRDRSLVSFLTNEERSLFAPVEMWLETCPKSSGFEVLLNPRAPVIAARQPEYFVTRQSWRQFIEVIDRSAPRKLFSICLNDELMAAKRVIAQHGLEVGQLTPVDLPFFSHDRIGMMLIEVRRPQEPEAIRKFESLWTKGAFSAFDYREEIVALDPPSAMRPGQKIDIRFEIRNLGQATWPAEGAAEFGTLIDLGDHWIAGGSKVEDSRASLKADLPPGAETETMLTVTAPSRPGDYSLEIDMVHEGVTWFSQRGARPLRLSVRVTP
jgi:hypothetical protein